MIKYLFPIIIACTTFQIQSKEISPKITLIFVIDQFPYRYTTQLKKNLQTGIHRFLEEGYIFTNAHQPHGMPATCTGHTALNTGAYADTHGIVGNAWYSNGKKIACDDDAPEASPVLNPLGGFYKESKSAQAILVDGISDQFALASTPEQPKATYSFGVKSRATIATANKIGTPFWLDTRTGMFTTSVAYVKTLPEWLVTFNTKHQTTEPIIWKQKYTNPSAYPYGTQSYQYLGTEKPLVNTTIAIDTIRNNPYSHMLLTPHANQLVLDACNSCMDNYFAQNKEGSLLIWACLGSLDKVGHAYGPMSKEVWDMIYWLDDQIDQCIRHAEKLVGTENVLSILTSDHGVPPIPEEAHALGLTNSIRLDGKKLIAELNKCIEQEFGIPNAIHDLKNSSLYFSSRIKNMPKKLRLKLAKRIQKQLHTSPHIAHAWLPDELDQQQSSINTIPYRLKRQFFTGRSGDIVIETRPYVLLTMKSFGVGHIAPYTYNTHVPLMFLWPNHLHNKKINTKVTTTQLAPTLAHILHVAQPASAEDNVLFALDF